MSWNPLKKTSVTRQASGQNLSQGLNNHLALENHLNKLQQLEETSRKLYKSTKKTTESIAELAKQEQKLTQNLSSSHICHYSNNLRVAAEEYHSVVCNLDPHTNELILVSQKGVVEPVKRFNNIFTHLNTVTKKREQQIQEVQKWQNKVEKQQKITDKERTGPNIAKTEQLKKSFSQANNDLTEQNTHLLRELPSLYDGRIAYIQPSLDALIRSQVEYFGETIKLFNELSSGTQPRTLRRDEEFAQRVQKKINDIRTLSIVAND